MTSFQYQVFFTCLIIKQFMFLDASLDIWWRYKVESYSSNSISYKWETMGDRWKKDDEWNTKIWMKVKVLKNVTNERSFFGKKIIDELFKKSRHKLYIYGTTIIFLIREYLDQSCQMSRKTGNVKITETFRWPGLFWVILLSVVIWPYFWAYLMLYTKWKLRQNSWNRDSW